MRTRRRVRRRVRGALGSWRAGGIFALALAQLLAGSADASDASWPGGRLTLTTGLDFRSGDYGLDRDTDLWYAPLTAKLLLDAFPTTPTPNDQIELAVTVPYVEIHGPSEFVTVGGVVDTPEGSTEEEATKLRSSRDRGVGDVVGRITWLWFPEVSQSLPAIEVTGRVKFPTGDEDRGLGTGAFETSAQLDLYRSFSGITPVLSGGYRFFGASREFHLENGAFASVGVTGRATSWLAGGVFLDWREAASRGVDDLVELVPYLVFKPHRRLTLQPYAIVGFTESSADYGVGLQLSTFFDLPARPRR